MVIELDRVGTPKTKAKLGGKMNLDNITIDPPKSKQPHIEGQPLIGERQHVMIKGQPLIGQERPQHNHVLPLEALNMQMCIEALGGCPRGRTIPKPIFISPCFTCVKAQQQIERVSTMRCSVG